MARHPSGWLGLVLMIALASMAACNLSDPVTFTTSDDCATDDDCSGHGECVDSGGRLVCECDDLFEGDTCGECVDGYSLDGDACVADDDMMPDMGGSDGPCLEVTPEALNFGQIEVGRAAVLTATITNCSETDDLTVDEVTLCEDTDAGCEAPTVFELDTITPELPATLEPGGTASVRVRFIPDEGTSTGSLEVTAGDLSDSSTLSGEALGPDCIDIIAQARTMMNPTWAEQLTIRPFQSAELRALATQGAAGTIQRHEWSITGQPTGSMARLIPDNMAASPMLFVDSPGDYVVEVTAYDANDEPSCDPATVMITAEVQAALWVDIRWDTPNDPDQMDATGADMDLHFMHPQGTWNMAPWDIYAGNPTADWGVSGSADDDPMLIRDDADGIGPEYVILNTPEDLTYRVGVYGANDRGFGTSDVTLRVFVNGMLQYTTTGPVQLREFWFVGAIDWAGQSFSEVNQVTLGFPP